MEKTKINNTQHELALEYEIRTTATAANVLFGFWSHDIGGNHIGDGCPGTGDPSNYTSSELLLRWVQFGALSPVLRTHCDHCERRPWMFPFHAVELIDAYHLRAALGPYIYSEARAGYDSAVVFVHPMYYDHPINHPEAYSFTHQYMFGDNIISAPISDIVGNTSGVQARKDVWLPPGIWTRWDGSETLAGPIVDTRNYSVAEMPLFVSAGSVLPFKGSGPANVQATSPDLVWVVWTCPSVLTASYTVYEDDGVSLDYLKQPGAQTHASYTLSSGNTTQSLQLSVSPTVGSYSNMPASRAQGLQLRGLAGGVVSTVLVNGLPLPRVQAGASRGWWLETTSSLANGPERTLAVRAGSVAMKDGVVITVAWTSQGPNL